MLRFVSVLALTVLSAVPAKALEIAFWGGATVVARTAACDWPNVGDHAVASYIFPMAGTTNGDGSTISLSFGNLGGESFQREGTLTAANQPVEGFHIWTRAGSYNAQARVPSQSPPAANINTTTRFLTMRFVIVGWDNKAACNVVFDAGLTRYPY